jgi:hypothetical protein
VGTPAPRYQNSVTPGSVAVSLEIALRDKLTPPYLTAVTSVKLLGAYVTNRPTPRGVLVTGIWFQLRVRVLLAPAD